MSAYEITEKVCALIEEEKYHFILLNYANADIVGHTGNEKACVKAVEIIDECLEKLIRAVVMKKGEILITADHGNVEEVLNIRNGEIDTEHSANPVPLWYVTSTNHRNEPAPKSVFPRVAGLLSDVAPTILDIMKIEKPAEMTGESLLEFLK
jgi:2,3-bisphosphoglycerate-independent phosphoglycerate mutase